MTDLSNLTVRETQDSGRTIYQTITATIARRSDYNTNQYAIAGIDGFWERKMDLPQPELGGLYRMILASKPKGSSAKAGALYLDILQMERSDGDPTELAPRQPAAASGAGSGGEQPEQAATKPAAEGFDTLFYAESNGTTYAVSVVNALTALHSYAANAQRYAEMISQFPAQEGEPGYEAQQNALEALAAQYEIARWFFPKPPQVAPPADVVDDAQHAGEVESNEQAAGGELPPPEDVEELPW